MKKNQIKKLRLTKHKFELWLLTIVVITCSGFMFLLGGLKLFFVWLGGCTACVAVIFSIMYIYNKLPEE